MLTARRVVFIALLACAGAIHLSASSFHLIPIRVVLTDQKSSTTLQIVNRDDSPVTVQVHVLNWQARGAEELYTVADEILVNPPIARIAGHGTQLVRLALRHPTRVPVERAWRLIVEEVPTAPKRPGEVRMVFKVSIPIFQTDPGRKFSPQLTWAATHLPDGSFKVTASNRGNAHIQFKELSLLAEGTDAPIKSMQMAYILPAGSHEWVFHDESLKNATHIAIEAQTDSNGRKLHEEITSERQ